MDPATLVPIHLGWIVFGGLGIALTFISLIASRHEWKATAKGHHETLKGLAELDPSLLVPFGKPGNWRAQNTKIDGALVRRLAKIKRAETTIHRSSEELRDALETLEATRKHARKEARK